MKKIMLILVLTIVLISASYFVFHWMGGDWTIKSSEEVANISFTVVRNNSSDSVTGVIYLRVDGSAKKLASQDIITLNKQPMRAEYYNNGVAKGYKYIIEIKTAEEYLLSIRREGREELKRTVKPVSVTVNAPSIVQKSKGISIPYTGGGANKEHISVEFSSLETDVGQTIDDDELVTNDYKRSLSVDFILNAQRLNVSPEELQSLKKGIVLLKVGSVFNQKEGVYAITHEKEVEIVE